MCGKPWIKGCKQGDGGSTFSQCPWVTPIDLSLSPSPSYRCNLHNQSSTCSLACVYLTDRESSSVVLDTDTLYCCHFGAWSHLKSDQYYLVLHSSRCFELYDMRPTAHNYIQDTLSRMENRALAACCVCGKPWIKGYTQGMYMYAYLFECIYVKHMYAIQCKFKGTAHANCCLHAMRSWHKGHLTSNLGHPTIASLSKWVGTLPTMCQDSKKKFLKAYWTPEYHWVFGGYSMASCAGWWSHKSQWWDCSWW